jgi:hypothetical protein
MSLVFEIQLLLALLFIAIAAPRLGLRAVRPVEKLLGRVARRKWLAVCTVGVVSLVINVSLGLFVHLPAPAVHDEFCYLLTADTFAHGRLTNPTHPHWEHFESWHTIQQPSYQAKYPPGQGLVLAAGQVVFGHPIAGVWISLAFACAAVCWMLQAWLPGRWAFLGALLFAVSMRACSFWGQSYWGGAVAMAGGALLFGSLPRLMKSPRIMHAFTLGLGVLILANARPYEGLLASVPAAFVLFRWMLSSAGPSWSVSLRRIVLPVAGVLLTGAVCMGYYNARVTGNPFRMPYQVWAETYVGTMRTTLWTGASASSNEAPTRVIPITSPDLRTGEPRPHIVPWHAPRRSLSARLFRKTAIQWSFYVLPLLTPALFLVVGRFDNRWIRFAAGTTGLVMAAILLASTGGYPHYTAPVASLIILLILTGLRNLRLWKWNGRPSGRFFVAALPAAAASVFAFALVTEWIPNPYPAVHSWHLDRESIRRDLTAKEGQHLVIVHYSPKHIWHFEWVYNGADIDGSKVVWARDLGRDRNRELIRHFSDHNVWLVHADSHPPAISRYQNGSARNAQTTRKTSFASSD